MFWGVTLEPGKRYAQTVDASYHLTMAALVPGPSNENTSVYVEHDKQEFLLCTLNNKSNLQIPLNLIFIEGQNVAFFINGNSKVALTGYLLPPDEEGFDGLGDFDEDASDEEVSDLSDEEAELAANQLKRKQPAQAEPASKKKVKVDVPAQVAKGASAVTPAKGAASETNGKVGKKPQTPGKAPVPVDSDEDEDDSDEMESEDFATIMANIKAAKAANGGADEDSDEDEDEEDDDDDDDDESGDDEEILKATQAKLKGALVGKGAAPQTPKQKGTPAQQAQQKGQTPKQQQGGKPPQQNQQSGQKGQQGGKMGFQKGGKPGQQGGGQQGGGNKQSPQAGNKGPNAGGQGFQKGGQNSGQKPGGWKNKGQQGGSPGGQGGNKVKQFNSNKKPFGGKKQFA